MKDDPEDAKRGIIMNDLKAGRLTTDSANQLDVDQ